MSKKHNNINPEEIKETEIIDEPIETESEVIEEEPKKKFDKKKLLLAGGILGTAIIGAAGFLLGKRSGSVSSFNWEPDDDEDEDDDEDDDLSDSSDDVSAD